MDRKEACEVLGLPQGCTDAEVTDAFRRLAKACHPDAGGTDYLFRKISEAKDTLKSKREPWKPGDHSAESKENREEENVAGNCPRPELLCAL